MCLFCVVPPLVYMLARCNLAISDSMEVYHMIVSTLITHSLFRYYLTCCTFSGTTDFSLYCTSCLALLQY